MKTKSLMLIAAIPLVASFLHSCSMDPYEITAKEEYTREFIKQFGLIDPTQDWNMAQATSITLNVGDTHTDAKIYANVSGKYYLVADLKQVSGEMVIPVDIPKGVTDMLVKANGKTFKAAPGGNVDINGVGSRSIASGVSGGNFEKGGFKLNVAQNGYAMYNTQQLAPINYTSGPWADYYSLSTTKGGSGWMRNEKSTSGFMPEINGDRTKEKYKPGTGNLYAKDDYNGREINRDFYIKPGDDGSFTIQPVFWNTSGNHTLCVYPLDDEGNPISKTTGKPLRLKDFDQVVDKSYLKDNVLDWEYLKDHTLEEVKSHIVSGKEYTVLEKVHEAVKALTDDILIMPFFDDKTADDIQLASVIVPSGTLSSLQINNNNVSLFIGDSKPCDISYSPSDYVGIYSVTSSDENVVEAWITYYSNYPKLNVKGLAEGSAVVTVTSQGISAQVTVTVDKGNVTLKASTSELLVGESLEIGVDKTGLYKDKPIVFSSSDTNVLTVDGNKVTAAGLGQATITGKCDDLTREVVITVCKESDHYYIKVRPDYIDYNTEIGKRYRSNEWGGWKFSEDVTVEEFVSDMASYFSESSRLNAISGNDIKAPTGTKAGEIANYTFAGIYDWYNTTGDSESELTAFPGEWGEIAVKVARNSDSFSAPRHYPAPAPRHIQSPLSASRAESTDDDSMPECLKEDNVTGWTNVGSYQETFTQDQLNTPNLARSMTYKVDITIDGAPYAGNLGMCIIYDNDTFFSQTLLNYAINASPCPDKVSPCFAASFLHPMSGRVFFSFEDWHGSESDTDLQDLIFILTDAEKIEGTNTIDPDPDPEPDITEETISWLVAAEDLGVVDDFDFNDVIFTVTSVTTNKTDQVDAQGNAVISKKVTVQALSAGGTLETYLHFNNGTTDYVLGPNGYDTNPAPSMEWHKWFNGSSYTEMINTGRTRVEKPSSIDISEIVPSDFSMTEYCKVDASGRIYGFYITVNGWKGTMADVGGSSTNDNGEVKTITSSEPGAAPQMFVIPDIGHIEGQGWHWPVERTHIMDAYENFGKWVNNKDEGAEWYKKNSSGRIMRVNP